MGPHPDFLPNPDFLPWFLYSWTCNKSEDKLYLKYHKSYEERVSDGYFLFNKKYLYKLWCCMAFSRSRLLYSHSHLRIFEFVWGFRHRKKLSTPTTPTSLTTQLAELNIKFNPHAVGRDSWVHFSFINFLVNILKPISSKINVSRKNNENFDLCSSIK